MRYVRACVLAVLLSGPMLRAGIGPQNTVVVVNADSFASKAVANEYVSRRSIPACNIVELHLNPLRDFEQVGVEEFRKLVLIPVLDMIRARGLADQIDCIAYSSDIPYAIRVSGDIGTRKLPLVITPVASLNGLTFLYQKVLARDTGYLKLDANHYAPRVIGHPLPSFTPAEEEKVGNAGALARQKKWAEAAAALSEVADAHPQAYEVLYDLACCLAQGGKADEGMAALTKAVDAGFWNAGLMQDDDDLNALKKRQDFKGLLHRIKPPPIVLQPSRGFSGTREWGGRKYLLSTMLAVTSGRGNSVAESCEMIRRCAAADGTLRLRSGQAQPKGTVYYMLNGDIRSTTRRWGFQAAVEKLRAMGVGAEIVNAVLPKEKPDVAGAMVGIAGFDWNACGSTILPGAICEHLTSCGGIMVENGGQTPISAF
ncbi:MAG TPA: hypothetical protein VNA25_07960, partial [Phycisphaerae bacterium]|nr:hypothetical protein [Phycisphaerae bacterium]